MQPRREAVPFACTFGDGNSGWMAILHTFLLPHVAFEHGQGSPWVIARYVLSRESTAEAVRAPLKGRLRLKQLIALDTDLVLPGVDGIWATGCSRYSALPLV